MSNITNNSPVVTEEKLTEFYNDIKPFLGCPAYVTQEGDAEYYSTDEKVIGRWTDGKPLYQKVVDCGALPNNTTKTVAHGVSNSEIIFIKNAFAFRDPTSSNFVSFPINMYDINTPSASVRMNMNKTNIMIRCDYDMSNYSHCFAVIQYTKTTDSAVTTTEQKSTHYSTDEQVVGTWIDGKPLYQKTVSCGALPNKTTKNVAHGITNIDYIVSIQGTSTKASGNPVIHIPYHSVNDVGGAVIAYIDNGNICLETKVADLSAYTRTYITLQYTKTTD